MFDTPTTAAMLILAHLLADFPLQGSFMATAKNPKTAIPGIPSLYVMSAHSAIHALLVYLITGNAAFMVIEFFIHAVTDTAKCVGLLTFSQDQAIHIATKLAFAVWIYYGALT